MRPRFHPEGATLRLIWRWLGFVCRLWWCRGRRWRLGLSVTLISSVYWLVVSKSNVCPSDTLISPLNSSMIKMPMPVPPVME